MIKLSIVLVFVIGLTCSAGIRPFIESFDGNGPHAAENVDVFGFDNPGWIFLGDMFFDVGGLRIEVTGNTPPMNLEGKTIQREFNGKGNFVESIRFSDIFFTLADHPVNMISGAVTWEHFLAPKEGAVNRIVMAVSESDNDPETWLLRLTSGDTTEFHDVPSGASPSFEIHYDDVNSQVEFFFDNEVNDETMAITYGPFRYNGLFDEEFHFTQLSADARFETTKVTIDSWSLLEGVGFGQGDFNRNSVLDAGDIGLLTTSIQQGSNEDRFDLNSDGQVDEFDRNIWVKDIARTWFGDSNLDGEFNSSDLVNVFIAAEYEDNIGMNSTWETGDWNGDGDFNSRDLVFAFGNGGFEVGPAGHKVPEPGGMLLTAIGLIFLRRSSVSARTA